MRHDRAGAVPSDTLAHLQTAKGRRYAPAHKCCHLSIQVISARTANSPASTLARTPFEAISPRPAPRMSSTKQHDDDVHAAKKAKEDPHDTPTSEIVLPVPVCAAHLSSRGVHPACSRISESRVELKCEALQQSSLFRCAGRHFQGTLPCNHRSR